MGSRKHGGCGSDFGTHEREVGWRCSLLSVLPTDDGEAMEEGSLAQRELAAQARITEPRGKLLSYELHH